MRKNTWPIDLSTDPLLRQSFDILRDKWCEVPFRAGDRIRTRDLLARSDEELVAIWQEAYSTTSEGPSFSIRGWYHDLYRDQFRGRKVLDVGCGLSPSGIHFAEHGAWMTFVDVVPENVEFVRRVCTKKNVKCAAFLPMQDLASLDLLGEFDFVFCCGSFIHMPLEMARMEGQAIVKHLALGGRWIELGYPRARWEREGRLAFNKWGDKTDGGAPWVEWHDLAKIREMLAPASFEAILDFEFHKSDFNWFDLVRRS